MTRRLLRSVGGHLRQRGHHAAFRIAPPVWDESRRWLARLLHELAVFGWLRGHGVEPGPAAELVAFGWLRGGCIEPGPAAELVERGERAAADGDLRELRAVNAELRRLVPPGGLPWT